MNDQNISKLTHIMNSSWERSPHYMEGEEFSEEEIKKYISTHAIGEEFSREGWGEEIFSRWSHYLKCAKEMPPEETPLEIEVLNKSLTATSTNLLNNFEFDPVTHQWLPSTEVSLNKGYDILSDMLSLQRGADLVQDESSWIIGNIAAYLQDKYEDEYDISLVAKATNRAIKTVMMYTSVFKAFQGRRVYGVSFSHHKEMMYVKNLPTEEAIMCLEVSRDNELSLRDSRALGKIVAKKVVETENVVTEVTEDMIHQATLGNMATLEYKYLIINSRGQEKDITGEIPIDVFDDAKYIFMFKPRMRRIKGKWPS